MKIVPKAVVGSLALSAFLAAAPVVKAEPFEITSSGIWTATVPPTIGSPDTLTGIGTNEIRWGVPDSGEKSGYRFLGLGPGGAHPTLSIATLSDLLSGEFDVGDFTHINFPITGGSISSAQLKVTLNLTDTGPGGGTQVLNFTFNFTHNETDNFPSPAGTGSCPDTGTTPVPAVGCPDVVGLQTLFSNEVVNIGGVDRVLEIIGFVPGHSGSPVSQFITQENQENLASLLVRFSTPIDEPATLALLGLGLLGLGWQHRRRG